MQNNYGTGIACPGEFPSLLSLRDLSQPWAKLYPYMNTAGRWGYSNVMHFALCKYTRIKSLNHIAV